MTFVKKHEAQFEYLGIPDIFFSSTQEQLERVFLDPDEYGNFHLTPIQQERLLVGNNENMQRLVSTEFGAILMIPYLCTWDMTDHRGFWDSLSRLTLRTLRAIHLGLQTIGKMDDAVITSEVKEESNMTLEERQDHAIMLMNEICDSPLLWSRVILYRTNTQNGSRVRGALPAPPYWSQIPINDETDETTEGDLSGPFPFVYYPILEAKLDGDIPSIDCSLVYVNPNRTPWKNGIPTIDFVPPYSVPNRKLRCIRYAALLVDENGGAPSFAIEAVKTMYANFVHQMHLVRQKKLEVDDTNTSMNANIQNPVDTLSLLRSNHNTKLPQKVYTDSNDPMELGNPECGLAKDKFVIVHDPNEADIIFSYKSLFSSGPLREIWQTKRDRQILINQFPYEGALVQKDHLGREICRQHGLPLPSWALETYDLEVQLGEFVGASLCEADRSGGTLPLWIIKPSNGTQSQGHVITRNLGQVLRLVDACGGNRVAQRYIENPVCFQGRKVDCRCIVLMTSARNGYPSLYMYKRLYFRIAAKSHSISTPGDLTDHHSVLSAMHLLDKDTDVETTVINKVILPIDTKTIIQLEKEYSSQGFQWKELILPKIKNLIRELFTNVTRSFPSMGEKDQYRAIYGVDIMFSIESEGIEPKLTEVSFCPANNAICDAYERDENDYKNYNTDIFSCLFLGELPDSIVQLQ